MSEERANVETGVSDSEAGRASGPDQQLVAVAAERTGPETMPEGERAVAPGEAARYAAIQSAIHDITKTIRRKAWSVTQVDPWLSQVSRLVDALCAQPDSDVKRSERSGRRNNEVSR